MFVSGAALAKLGHPQGEANITRGCGRMNIIQMVSSNASLSCEEIAVARVSPDQPLFFQLYKHSDEKALERIREIERLGYGAIFLTVDAPIPGYRERDIRAPYELAQQELDAERKARHMGSVDAPQSVTDSEKEEEEIDTLGTAGALLRAVDTDMSWERVFLTFHCYFPRAELTMLKIFSQYHGSEVLLNFRL